MRLIDKLKENAPLVIFAAFGLLIYLTSVVSIDTGEAIHHPIEANEEIPDRPPDDPLAMEIVRQNYSETELLEDITIEQYHNSAAFMERLSLFLEKDYSNMVGGGRGSNSAEEVLVQWTVDPAEAEAIIKAVDRKTEKYRTPQKKNLDWGYLKAGTTAVRVRKLEDSLRKIYNSLPASLKMSRKAIAEYVEALQALRGFGKPDLSVTQVAFLLEELDLQVTKMLRREGVTREVYGMWTKIDLSIIVGSKTSHNYKLKLAPPFRAGVKLTGVWYWRPPGTVNNVDPAVLRVTFRMGVVGEEIADIGIYHNGRKRAGSALRPVPGKNYREAEFKNVDPLPYELIVSARDGSTYNVKYDFTRFKGTEGFKDSPDSHWLYHEFSEAAADRKFRVGANF